MAKNVGVKEEVGALGSGSAGMRFPACSDKGAHRTQANTTASLVSTLHPPMGPGSTLPAATASILAEQEPDPGPVLLISPIPLQSPRLSTCFSEIGAACKGARLLQWLHALHRTMVLVTAQDEKEAVV